MTCGNQWVQHQPTYVHTSGGHGRALTLILPMRQVTTACRLLHENAEASAAFADCFARDAHTSSGHGEKVPAAELLAGDLVLSSPNEATRVLVNQHRAVSRQAVEQTVAECCGRTFVYTHSHHERITSIALESDKCHGK